MTIWPPSAVKQNSAYGPTCHPLMTGKPYPEDWERVAELRVFRTTSAEWENIFTWRADMVKRGWKLLRVSHNGPELVAVFGRPKTLEPS